MNNGNVKWTQIGIITLIIVGILGVVWTKLEKIDDAVGSIQIDIAVIKQQINKSAVSTSTSSNWLDRMFSSNE
jgi:hypothetical protein